jgi:electron transfer flavoprotein alpha subunit
MAAAPRQDEPSGEIITGHFHPEWQDRTRVVEVLRQAQAATISDADVVVAVGRGLRQQRDLELVERLATALGGMVGCTRPLVEQGWLPNTRQIGLSGRTVRPRLYIAAGLSGAIQHVAGMRGSDLIFAINQDRQAPIFDVAHYALVGDLYEIIPELTQQLTEGGGASAL